jgi:predicted dehydrogenase
MSLRPERAKELVASGYRAFSEVSEAEKFAPMGVVIATDTGRHVSDALPWVERGCDVLVEKPLAANRGQATSLAERVRAAGRHLYVACCLRFDEGLQFVRESLPQLGRLHAADVECLSWLPDWRPGRSYSSGYAARPGEGGVLLDLIHEIDYCQWLFGATRRVWARLSNQRILDLPSAVEEEAVLVAEHDAVTVTIRLSYAIRPASRQLRIWGEHGMLRWDGIRHTAQLLTTDGAEQASTSWSPETMYRAQASAFADAVVGNRSGVLATLDEGMAALAVCDAAREASARRNWQEISS